MTTENVATIFLCNTIKSHHILSHKMQKNQNTLSIVEKLRALKVVRQVNLKHVKWKLTKRIEMNERSSVTKSTFCVKEVN